MNQFDRFRLYSCGIRVTSLKFKYFREINVIIYEVKKILID